MSYLAIFLILVGFILLAIGSVLLFIHPTVERAWWMWVSAALGGVLLFLGIIVLIYSRRTRVIKVKQV